MTHGHRRDLHHDPKLHDLRQKRSQNRGSPDVVRDVSWNSTDRETCSIATSAATCHALPAAGSIDGPSRAAGANGTYGEEGFRVANDVAVKLNASLRVPTETDYLHIASWILHAMPAEPRWSAHSSLVPSVGAWLGLFAACLNHPSSQTAATLNGRRTSRKPRRPLVACPMRVARVDAARARTSR